VTATRRIRALRYWWVGTSVCRHDEREGRRVVAVKGDAEDVEEEEQVEGARLVCCPLEQRSSRRSRRSSDERGGGGSQLLAVQLTQSKTTITNAFRVDLKFRSASRVARAHGTSRATHPTPTEAALVRCSTARRRP
jgi:hypothetical protein